MSMRIRTIVVIQWLISVLWMLLCISCTPQPVYKSRGGAANPSREREPAQRTESGISETQADSQLPDPGSLPRAPTRTDAHPVSLSDIDTSRAYQVGVASYYGKKFHGRATASGETFNMYRLTAAHRVLPLGTRVRVTNLTNGRWVDVKINDRGPFVPGRVLDLSFAAALEVDMVGAGTARVMIEIVSTPD